MKPKPTLRRYLARCDFLTDWGERTPVSFTQDRKKPLGKRGAQDHIAKEFGVLRSSVNVLSIEEVKP